MPSFPKSARILKRGEFEGLWKKGIALGNPYFGLRWQRGKERRLGIVVGRKAVGRAVQRNRIKRVIREFFRNHPEKFPMGDIILVARRGIDGLNNEAIREGLTGLLERKK